jgi:cytochrome c oxidase cbb3-type subunit III
MKFINYLKDITGVSIFPLIGLVIFVAFFIGVTFYVYGADKKSWQEKGKLPLEN